MITTLLDLMDAPTEERSYRFASDRTTKHAIPIMAPIEKGVKQAKKKGVVRIYPDIADKGNWLFCDGGVINRNPSTIGGTWAWVLVKDGEMVAQDSGVVTPEKLKQATATNNNSELLALCKGIMALPVGWYGTVASDSGIALGWIFKNYKRDLIPEPLNYTLTATLLFMDKFLGTVPHLNLAGHPKPADMAAQKRLSKAPHLPVSRWNVLCDHLCGERARDYMATQSAEIK